jgi:hypothetical protein
MAEFGLGSNYTGIISVGGISQDNGGSYGRTLVRTTVQVRKNAGSGYYNGAGGSRSWSTSGIGNSGSSAYDYRGATPQTQTLAEWDSWINHDVNGNMYIGVGCSISHADNPPGSGSGSQGYTAPRIAGAPTISSLTVDTIKPTTARLGGELSSVGHGTSASWTMYYRLQGTGSWTSAGAQGDAGGYNYWNLTGLKPGKTYEYYATCANNNGDTATSGTQTFKTQSVPGAAVVMLKLAGL